MPRLKLTDLGRTFGEDPPIVALTGVNLTIDPGAYVAIEGPSGSGKSTLLNQLALVDRPTSGNYTIDSVPVSGLSERQRARLRSDTFGFVFQNFHLMPRRSALENVEVGLLYRGLERRERRQRAVRALQAVGLAHRLHIAARKLSGGEQQRVAIARAMLGDAPVVVADEPTGNLDSQSGDGIVAQLDALHERGTAVVLVTHDPDVAAHARQRITLRDGTVTAARPSSTPTAQSADAACAAGVPGRASRLRLADLVRESWHALRDRPGRTALLIAAVGIAIGMVMITLGLTQSASAQVSSQFDLVRNRDVTVNVPTTYGTGTHGTATYLSAVPSDVEARLAQIHGITAAGVVETHDPVTVTNVGQQPLAGVNIVGISPGALTALRANVTWAPGHTAQLGRHEILLGTNTAENLQIGPLVLDPAVEIDGTPYGVAGIVGGSDRLPQISSDIAVAWQHASELSQLDDSTVFITTLGGAAQQVAHQAPLAIDPVHADQLETTAPPDPASLRAKIQNDVSSSLLALTVVALLASILGVANTMLLGVIERIGELGLRRAIGARPTHILGQTSVEAIIAGALGGIAGLIVSVSVILGITIINHWQPVLDLRLIPLALAGGICVGTLGGLPASIRASRIQPADALRR